MKQVYVTKEGVVCQEEFIPFIAIDPRRKGALKHSEQAYHEWGMNRIHIYIKFTQEEKEMILGKAAYKVLGI